MTGASLSLRAGDKVGLVGRNGVGKTSLLKVLAGDAPAAAGVVARTGAVGYLSQDPSPRGTGLDGTAIAHVLSARGLDAASSRLALARNARFPRDASASARARCSFS